MLIEIPTLHQTVCGAMAGVVSIATNPFVVSATALPLRNIYLKANLAKTLVSAGQTRV